MHHVPSDSGRAASNVSQGRNHGNNDCPFGVDNLSVTVSPSTWPKMIAKDEHVVSRKRGASDAVVLGGVSWENVA